VRPRHHGRELDPAGIGGQKRQGCVALKLIGLRTPHNGVLPEVVRHADEVESCLLGGPRDLGQRRAETDRSSGPAKVVDLEPEFHETMPPFLAIVIPFAGRILLRHVSPLQREAGYQDEGDGVGYEHQRRLGPVYEGVQSRRGDFFASAQRRDERPRVHLGQSLL
jgi:hypothetical protein